MVKRVLVLVLLCTVLWGEDTSLFAQGREDYSCTSSEEVEGGPDSLEEYGFYEAILKESFDRASAILFSLREGSWRAHSLCENEAVFMGLDFESLRQRADYEAILDAIRHAYISLERFLHNHKFEVLLASSRGSGRRYYKTLSRHLSEIASKLEYLQGQERGAFAYAENLLYALVIERIQGILFNLSGDVFHCDNGKNWDRQSVRSILALLCSLEHPVEQRLIAWSEIHFSALFRAIISRNLEFIRLGNLSDFEEVCDTLGISVEAFLGLRDRANFGLAEEGLSGIASFLERRMHMGSDRESSIITYGEILEHRALYNASLLLITEKLQQFLREMRAPGIQEFESLRFSASCMVFFIGYSEIGDDLAAQGWGFRALHALVRALSYHVPPVYATEPELPLIPDTEYIPVAIAEDSLLSLDVGAPRSLGEAFFSLDPLFEQ